MSSALQSWKQRELQVIDGRFALRQYLGGSEHSAVFLTERGKPRPVKAAIKLVPVAAAGDDQLALWQSVAKLSHPHLLQIFESGRCQFDNEPYFYVVMEYADEDLSQIVPSRALSAAEAHDMLPPVIDVLRYLHDNGLAHGHIKPSNIMAVNDQLRLASDGVCRVGECRRRVPEPTVYDAPEAEKSGPSPVADVWSLGMTLVEVLTQRPPMREGAEGELLLPQTVPMPFREIASNCLRRDPEKRWTLEQIDQRLRPAKPQPTPKLAPKLVPKPESQPSPVDDLAANGQRKWLKPVIAVLVVLAAIFVVIKFIGEPTARNPVPSGTNAAVEVPGNAGARNPSPDRSSAGSTAPAAGGVTSGVVEQVMPDVSRGALNTVQGTIKVNVRVNVNAAGTVSNTRFERRGPSDYFARKTMEAARKWKFAPGAARAWVLHFEFRRSGTRVIPQPINS